MILQYYKNNQYLNTDKQNFDAAELSYIFTNLNADVSVTVWFV